MSATTETLSSVSSSSSEPTQTRPPSQDPRNTSSNLYLFTFLATLLLLLCISSAIVTRSFILRRRFRRQVEEALAQGYILGPPTTRGQGPVFRRIGDKPKLFDAWVSTSAPNDHHHHQDAALLWEDIKPLSALPVSASYEEDIASQEHEEQEHEIPLPFPNTRRRRQNDVENNHNNVTSTRRRGPRIRTPHFLPLWARALQRDDMVPAAYETRQAAERDARAATATVDAPPSTTNDNANNTSLSTNNLNTIHTHNREQTDVTLVDPPRASSLRKDKDKMGGKIGQQEEEMHLQVSVFIAMPVPPDVQEQRDDEEEVPNMAIGTMRCAVKGVWS